MRYRQVPMKRMIAPEIVSSANCYIGTCLYLIKAYPCRSLLRHSPDTMVGGAAEFQSQVGSYMDRVLKSAIVDMAGICDTIFCHDLHSITAKGIGFFSFR